MKNLKAAIWFPIFCLIFLGVLWGNITVCAETDAQLIARYEPIWNEAFKKQNGFSDVEFKKNISVTNKSIMHSDNQKYICLKYVQQIDWLSIPCYDQIMIYMSSKEDSYRHIPLPRGVFFSPADIDLAIQKRVDATALTKVQKTGKLAYSSLEEAKTEVKKKTGITSFFSEEVSFFVPGKLPRVDGDPYFIFKGTKEPAKPAKQVPSDKKISPSGRRDTVSPRPDYGSRGRGIVPADLEKKTLLQAPAGMHDMAAPNTGKDNPGDFYPQAPKGPASCEDPNLTDMKKPVPPGGDHEVMGIRAPDPGDSRASETCTKGYLNLVTKELKSWEDATINY